MNEKRMTLEAQGLTFTVKFDDEGVVMDIFDEDGEVVATTYRFYTELGLIEGEQE